MDAETPFVIFGLSGYQVIELVKRLRFILDPRRALCPDMSQKETFCPKGRSRYSGCAISSFSSAIEREQ